ncbi:aldose reductase [Agrilus planipennis]|uniref:Aldose reductase n=1 Tax=Agrilus planipennis TaxID=224129 RepID=A0A7F5R6R8_AGRPL|nr:aldose reductase [Agrilus planipennis]
MPYVKLSAPGDVQMPLVGLGTWKATNEEIDKALTTALDAGYRQIDTAFNYNNEEAIGSVLKKWISSGKGKRENVFITTKLPVFGNRAGDVEKYLNWSLKNLQTDYVDLYLIHMPFSLIPDDTGLSPKTNEDGSFVLDLEANNVETWKAMEKSLKDGKIRALGVSNFNAMQVKKLYENSEIKPSVLQVELHAYLQQKDLRATCKELNIAITAYAPLGSPHAKSHFIEKYNYNKTDFPDILGHPVVKELAEKYNKTTGQILLRHLVQQNVIIIPKSSNPERIKQNIDVFNFELSPEDLERLNALDRGEDGRIFDFRFFKGITKHPEYPFNFKEE